jgi:subfamily B ATP-binding cassette protein MsbA
MARDMNIGAAPPQESVLKLMKRLVKDYMRPYIGLIAVAFFFMLISAAMTALLALLMKPILNDVMGGNKAMIIPVAFAVLATFVVNGITTFLHTIIMNKVSQSMIGDIQKKLFSHFMTLDLAFFHAHPSGQLISRVVNDVNVVRMALSETITNAGKNFMTFAFLTAVMVYQDWKLAIAAFIILPFSAGFIAHIGRKLRKISKNTQAEMGILSDRLSEIFQGIRQVKAYGMENHEKTRANEAIDKVRKLSMKSVRVGNVLTPVNEALIGLVMFGIIIYGGYEVSAGRMTAGQLASFLGAFTLAYQPVKRMARTNSLMQMGLGAAERIFQMMDLQPIIRDRVNARELQTQKPEVVFSNVEFRYELTDAQALRGVSFTAQPGKVLALVGRSGAGKSTVMNLIPRFYDAQGGSITIDGTDVRDLTQVSLRKHIALVSQDITIFDDTILSNIAYGRPGASEEDIRKAAKAAAAHDFIEAMPKGYMTRVGEDGVKISGGQRQRIAIARAILRNAPILLLDEATSALDNESEKAVQTALKELEKGRTTVVIAHRLSTVQSADQIIVLDQGRVAETGRHDDLMQKDGLYAKMYRAGLKD